MRLELNNEIEQELWISVYKIQLEKAKYPAGEASGNTQILFCANFADDTILAFRARAGKHSQVVPVIHGTHDNNLYKNLEQYHVD